MRPSEGPIIIEEKFQASVESIWKALTDHTQMTKWFFENIESFQPEIGFETKFEVQNGDRKFTHLWKLTEVIPYKKISYNWRYLEYPGNSFVHFELIEDKSFVKLSLTHVVVESFPYNIPEFKRESCIQGWNYFIKESLKKYLETK